MKVFGRHFLVGITLLAASSLGAQSLTTVYSHDFDSPVGWEWSTNTRTTTPNLERTFLGRFAGEAVLLNLTDLPEHCSVTISFDLLIIDSWEGSTGYYSGPDVWDLNASVPGDDCPVENLLHTTFANCSCGYQAYPDTFPNVYHPGLTGADEVESLGYERDSVYHLSFTFYHWRSDLQFSFAGSPLLQDWTDESWGLDNLVVQVNTESCCRAARRLPPVLVSNTDLPVTIDVHPNPDTQAYVVQEDPPSSWVPSEINDGGFYDEASGLIKWGPFFGEASRVLSYSLATPGGAYGTAHFNGTISVDGISESICGDTSVTGGSYHPADLNDDWVISNDEVTAYAAAWRLGEVWSRAPEIIPADFVTNAGMLWKAGGTYAFDRNSNPPWSSADSGKIGGGSLAASLSNLSVLPGSAVEVTLSAQPAAGTHAYSIQDLVPVGLDVSDAGEGIFDPSSRIIRFGPYFDDTQRELSYHVVVEDSISTPKTFRGSASFDGQEVLATGARVLQGPGLVLHSDSAME